MADCMTFPEDWHDYLKDYSFDDSKEVYTNGSLLIPVFRVEQLIEHLLEVQEPRILSAAEVSACPQGTVLWVEERQGVTWNLFPLEIEISSTHPDTGTDYLFFITYHDIRRFECSEYNQTWRCWTSRPTNKQREATPWE